MTSKRITISVVFLITFWLAPALFAMNHGHSDHHAAPADSAVHQGRGIVEAVDPATATVRMEHEPIESLRWPKMVMDLKAKDPELLKGLKEGDQVAFDLMQTDKGFLITRIEKMH